MLLRADNFRPLLEISVLHPQHVPSFPPCFMHVWSEWSKWTIGSSSICFVFSVLNFILKNKIAASCGNTTAGIRWKVLLEKRNWNVINSPSTEKALAGLQQEQTILYHPGKSGCQKVESIHVSHAEMHWGHVGITLIGYNRRAFGFQGSWMEISGQVQEI